jgi:hypothetical protein
MAMMRNGLAVGGAFKWAVPNDIFQISREVSLDDTKLRTSSTAEMSNRDSPRCVPLASRNEPRRLAKFDFSRAEIRSSGSSGGRKAVGRRPERDLELKELSSTLSVVSMLQSKYADDRR